MRPVIGEDECPLFRFLKKFVDMFVIHQETPYFCNPKIDQRPIKVNALSTYKTNSANASTVTKEWFVVDAAGQTLGRLSTQIARIIRGKHKPSFTPHVDCGDYVIIINADQVKLTGMKMETKQYLRHTGYPGGQRVALAKTLSGQRIIENAVRGMLPKNRLGRKIFHNMFVYDGGEHPHAAQKPKELKFDN